MRVGALQMCSSMDADENLAHIEEGCKNASLESLDYLQLPEMAVMFAEDYAQLKNWVESSASSKAIERLSGFAAQYGIFLHLGSIAVAGVDGKCVNRSILFSPDGEIVATYDKIHLFDADIAGDRPYRESDNFEPGRHAVLAPLGAYHLGFSICYDLRFPALFGALRRAGADILSVPAAFTVPTGRTHWESLLRARAIETGCYLVAAAQSGHHANGRKTFGHSMIISPWGEILASCTDEPSLLINAPLDEKAIAEARSRIPTLANERSFSLSVNHNAAQ